MTALLLSLIAAAPADARFVLELQGLPIAELRVSVRGTTYVYESTHFLEEGPKEHRVELKLDPKQPRPEVLALLTRPATGCRPVVEERTGALEQLCVDRAKADEASGTLDDVPFTARYDAKGKLTGITLPGVRWTAASTPTTPPLESPFSQGLVVPEGALVLSPPVDGARWLTVPPLGVGTEALVGRARCLVEARAQAARRPKARVSVGVVIEDGRAFPHAWLTEDGVALDPTVLPGDEVLARRRYLEVPVEKSGAFYLRLFDGAVRFKAR